jgi:hypothetical protein
MHVRVAFLGKKMKMVSLWFGTGVTCVEIDVVLNKITVLGYIDRKVVVKAVRKTGRRAEVVWPSSSSSCHWEKPRSLATGFGCIIPRWGF